MTIEIRVRDKYLSHQVKKVSPPKGGNSGSSAKKRFKLPNAVPRQATAARVRALVLINGRRSWTWR